MEDPRVRLARRGLAFSWTFYTLFLAATLAAAAACGYAPRSRRAGTTRSRSPAEGLCSRETRRARGSWPFLRFVREREARQQFLDQRYQGALAAIGTGMTLYVLAFTVAPGIGIFGMHLSFPCMLAATAAYVAVSLATPPPPQDIVRTFWGAGKPHELAGRTAVD